MWGHSMQLFILIQVQVLLMDMETVTTGSLTPDLGLLQNGIRERVINPRDDEPYNNKFTKIIRTLAKFD